MSVSKGEQTRREIVRKSAPLFNQKGYEGTSLSDLMKATGLKKGGIYRHFASKEELAGEAFDYSWAQAIHGRRQGLDEVSDCLDRLKRMIDNFVEKREGLVAGGCPLMNTAVETDDGNAQLRARAKKALHNWTALLSEITSEGIRKNQIDRSVDPHQLSQLIIGSLEGALLISRLRKDRAPLYASRRHLHDYLDQSVRAKSHSSHRGKLS